MAKTPRVTVTERNTQTDMDVLLSDPRYKARIDNPFGQPSAPIELKDNSRECRWFNATIQTDHIWRAKRKGWDQTRPDDVADLEQVGGYAVSPEGYIVRGERGHEILMSMPKVVRTAIQAAKIVQNNYNLANPHRMKAELTEAVGHALGDEAASAVQTHVTLTDNLERRERLPEGE